MKDNSTASSRSGLSVTGTSDPCWPRWFAAAGDAVIDGALRELYQRIDADIQSRGPTCWLSGKCCNFDAFDHRLYVTALEVAWMLRNAGPRPVDPKGPCSYQVDRLCMVHADRPLGCRVFFCQEGTQQWQRQLYERYLAELRALHEEHDLPYRYLEWRQGLQEAMDTDQSSASSTATCEG